MKKHKHIIHLLLAIIILFTMEAGFCTMNNTAVAKEKKFKTLTLKVKSCNTYFYLDDSQDFRYDYDKNLFDVHVQDDDLNRCITLSKKKKSKPTIDDKVLIYIPASLPFKNVIIEGKSGGISLCKMNRPITINANDSVFDMTLPKDFSESFHVTAVSSVISIGASKNTGINFSLKHKESVVGLPNSFPDNDLDDTKKKEYSYTHGDGVVDFTGDITDCVFDLTLYSK